jgi:hypothetical protein
VVVRPRETAIITIDMHRGRLGMEVAAMAAKPEDATRGDRQRQGHSRLRAGEGDSRQTQV